MAKLKLNNNANEYNLFGGLTAELIDIYGLEVSYIKVVRYGVDDVIGDITNYGFEEELRIMAMPDSQEGVMEERGDLLSKFGFYTNDGIVLYVSASTMQEMRGDDFQKSVGDLIKLPSGKLLEVVQVEHQVPGLNNQYTYSNKKNVFSLRCKSFNYNYDSLPDMSPDKAPSVDAQENDDFFQQNEKSSIEEIFGIINQEGDDSVSLEDMKNKQEEESPIAKDSENKNPMGDLWS